MPAVGLTNGGWPETKIGDAARRTREIQPEDIELFAAMFGDHNPVHVDAELAALSRFGGIVVQGGVTIGLLNALVAQDMPPVRRKHDSPVE